MIDSKHSGGLLLQGPRSGSANVQSSFAKVLHGEDLAYATGPHLQLRVSAGIDPTGFAGFHPPASSLGVLPALEDVLCGQGEKYYRLRTDCEGLSDFKADQFCEWDFHAKNAVYRQS